MHSQNYHKAPQKKKDKFEKLGEGVFFKKIPFPSEKKQMQNSPVRWGRVRDRVIFKCLYLYTYPYPLLQYRFKSG